MHKDMDYRVSYRRFTFQLLHIPFKSDMRLQQETSLRDFKQRLQLETSIGVFEWISMYFQTGYLICKATYLIYNKASVRVFLVNSVYAAFVHLPTM